MKAHAAKSEGADLGSIVALLPPWVVKFLSWRIRKDAGATGIFGNVVLSNVAGPRNPLCMNRTRLDNWFSTGQVFDGTSLNITLWSYCENANLCILADDKVLSDGWVLFEYFKDELEKLIEAGKLQIRQTAQENPDEQIETDGFSIFCTGKSTSPHPHGSLRAV